VTPQTNNIEYRNLTSPLTQAQEGNNKRFNSDHYVEGYATTFDKPYLLWEYDGIKYYEMVDRNAFDGADMSDVVMQYDHHGKIVARISNNTLGAETDDNGLFIYADLSKSRAAQDLYEEIRTGLVTKMSIGFIVTESSYNQETHTRTILKFKRLYDVSAVGRPANPDTEIFTRSFFSGAGEAEKLKALEKRKRLLALKLKLEA